MTQKPKEAKHTPKGGYYPGEELKRLREAYDRDQEIKRELLEALAGVDSDMEKGEAVKCDCEPCRLYETFRPTVRAAIQNARRSKSNV